MFDSIYAHLCIVPSTESSQIVVLIPGLNATDTNVEPKIERKGLTKTPSNMERHLSSSDVIMNAEHVTCVTWFISNQILAYLMLALKLACNHFHENFFIEERLFNFLPQLHPHDLVRLRFRLELHLAFYLNFHQRKRRHKQHTSNPSRCLHQETKLPSCESPARY